MVEYCFIFNWLTDTALLTSSLTYVNIVFHTIFHIIKKAKGFILKTKTVNVIPRTLSYFNAKFYEISFNGLAMKT